MSRCIITAGLLIFVTTAAYSQFKTGVVITTAQGQDLHLTQTATLEFKEMPQPLETEPCIFVDPRKTFQTFIGIGGALTDAAAETFAKLPKNK